jgi:hypothetical protein
MTVLSAINRLAEANESVRAALHNLQGFLEVGAVKPKAEGQFDVHKSQGSLEIAISWARALDT